MEKLTKYTAKIYDKYAEPYHRSMIKGRFYNKYIEMPAVKKLFKNLKGKRVLDAGCAVGTYSKYFVSKGAHVYGIDVSREMLKIAKADVPEADFRLADMKELPFKKCFFDIVFYGLSIHYVNDMKAVLKEARRVLKHNGSVVVSTMDPCLTGAKLVEHDGERKFLIEDYFGSKMEKWEMVAGMEIVNYSRTIAGLFNPFFEAGFAVTRVTEPRPSSSAKKVDPNFYRRTTKAPSFIIIEAMAVGK